MRRLVRGGRRLSVCQLAHDTGGDARAPHTGASGPTPALLSRERPDQACASRMRRIGYKPSHRSASLSLGLSAVQAAVRFPAHVVHPAPPARDVLLSTAGHSALLHSSSAL